MKLTKKLMLLGAIVANTAIFSQAGAEIKNTFEFAGGWRSDKVEQVLYGHDYKCGPVTDHYRDFADKINLGQFGLRGVFGLPRQTYNPCCDSFLDLSNVYVRWSAFWGWGSGGNYYQSFNDLECDLNSYSQCGKSRWANSQDYDVAIGVLFPLGCNFGIAPVGGYNYDRLKYSIRRLRSAEICPSDDGAHIFSRWEGPYLGFDAGYRICNFLIAAGYEYHWITSFRGGFRTPGDFYDTANSITDYRSGDRGWGNVAHVDLNYNWCSWDFGVNFKYRYFTLTNGRSRVPVLGEGCSTYTTVKANQQSYEVNAIIGMNF